jgi:hypothetical protein
MSPDEKNLRRQGEDGKPSAASHVPWNSAWCQLDERDMNFGLRSSSLEAEQDCALGNDRMHVCVRK